MGRYLVRRASVTLISFFVLASLCFFLLRLFPGGPFSDESQLNPKVMQIFMQQYELDLPLFQQYQVFLKKLIQFDLGRSILNSGKPVSQVILEVSPISLILGGFVLIFSLFSGVLFGTLGFLLQKKKLMRFLQILFLSTPTLFLAPVLILVFAFWLDLVPITLNQKISSYILPIFVLMIRPTVNFARLFQSSIEEAVAQPWALTKMAFGVSHRTIVLKHAARIALIPAITYLGASVASILSGSVLVETVFNIHGLGMTFIESLINRDYPLITGLTLYYGILLFIANFIVDLIVYVLDPRVQRA